MFLATRKPSLIATALPLMMLAGCQTWTVKQPNGNELIVIEAKELARRGEFPDQFWGIAMTDQQWNDSVNYVDGLRQSDIANAIPIQRFPLPNTIFGPRSVVVLCGSAGNRCFGCQPLSFDPPGDRGLVFGCNCDPICIDPDLESPSFTACRVAMRPDGSLRCTGSCALGRTCVMVADSDYPSIAFCTCVGLGDSELSPSQ